MVQFILNRWFKYEPAVHSLAAPKNSLNDLSLCMPQIPIFKIPISFPTNLGGLRHFKIWIQLDQLIYIWNIQGLHH